MKPQFQHDVVTSVQMWMDNLMTTNGQAFFNVTGLLQRIPDTTVPGVVYASPWKSWVFDSCTPGAIIPSGFMNASGQFLTRASGAVIDFVNGRVITPQNWGPYLSGVYAKKQVNVYYSSDDQLNYIMELVQGNNVNLSYTFTGLGGTIITAPLIMITNSQGHNEPWALGGMDNTKQTMRAFVICDNNYLQEGILSLIQDTAHTYIPLAPYSAAPITASGDLKSPPWSYCTGIKDFYTCASGLYIDNVYPYKLSERTNRNPTFFISAVEMDISKPRFTHG